MKRVARLVAPLALLLVAASSAASAATIECKTEPAPGVGGESDAKTSWAAYVTNRFGAEWADITLAKDWHQMWNPVAVIATWSGIPCRRVADPSKAVVVLGKSAVRR